ncbi:T9SS type A sorting domain-containing protein [Taibaiella chishuiensis]|uniref:Putative secreted protein (Por secretion system target) n=1 Tax=Taibaiella chishuiensis TaxID=1434707 RepID=A0A2P8DC15_9BACT|nr:T9SS type A sorting domain-containing protein [Taibaiella chishuiensis]PSK94749.1 putative secreted protein (Por secretion system target) [Taibaiella chishuiensis]
MTKHLFFLLLIAGCTGVCKPLYAQRCAQLSMESFGGNKSEGVSDRVIVHNDGTFSLYVESESTTGNINTSCSAIFPGGGPGSFYYRRYNTAGTSILNEYCAPKTTSFYPEYWFAQPNGDTIFIGNKEIPGRSDEIAIERRSASGVLLWSKYYGGTGSDGLGNVIPAPDGGFFIATGTNSTDGDVGLHYGSGFDADIWILRVDNSGDKLWGKVLGGTLPDLPGDIKLSPDGGCYVFGVTASVDHDAIGTKGESDLYIVKLDSLGQKQWHRCLGGTGSDGSGYDHAILCLEDGIGGFYILNRTSSNDGDVQRRVPLDDGPDFWLVHIDSLAHILWESTFGGPGWQVPSVFCRAADGSFWMGGQNLSSRTGGMIEVTYGMTDSWVVHADSLGNFINQRSFGNNKEDQVDMLYPLPDGTVLAGGRYYEPTTPGPASPGFPQTSEGELDIFLTRLGPETVGVRDKILDPATWEVFPNPGNRLIQFRVKNGDKHKYALLITDGAGRTRCKATFRDKLELDISQWAAGIYRATLSDRSGNAGTKNIVVSQP